NGDGTLQNPVAHQITGGGAPNALAVDYLDFDGNLDIVTANSNGTVSVLLGLGNGDFQPPKTFTAGGGSAVSVAVGDYNGDGKKDLAVANHLNAGTVSIMRGTGTGRYRAPQVFAAGANPNAVAAGDFDADGRLDLAVTNDGGAVNMLKGQ